MKRVALVSLLVCVACATVPRGDDGRVHALDPLALERVPIAARFDEPVALVDDYVSASGVSDRLRAAFPEELRARFVHDARLDHVARVRGRVYAATKQRLGDELEAQLLWRVGVTLPLIGSDVWVTEGRAGLGDTEVAAAVADLARAMPPDGRVRFGVSRFFAGKRVAIAVVRVRELVDFEVMPRSAQASAVVRIAGKAKGDVIAPVLSILEDGVVRELPVEVDEHARFAVELPLGEGGGVRWLELRDMGGRRSLAWWPLDVTATEVAPPVPADELARVAPGTLARGSTRPSAESVVAFARELGVELPERTAELDTAAMLLASSPDELPASRPVVCGEMWWLRFTARTEEELLWRARRSPATIALIQRARFRAGVAVARIDSGWRAALVECDRPPRVPATDDAAPVERAPTEAAGTEGAGRTQVVTLTSTPPGAQAWIRIDGEIRLLCKEAPCTAELPAGKKILIELRMDGHKSAQRTFTVEEGARFDGVLEKQ